MNKALKIGLIAIAVLVIGIVVWRTLIMPPAIKEIKFDKSVFTTQITTQTEESIDKAASFDKANQAFTSMTQDIDDAEFLENIGHDEAAECKKLIAQHFAPRLAVFGDSAFATTEWNVTQIDAMRDAAKAIIAANALGAKSGDLEKLQALVKNVDDYHAALALVSSSKSCSSESEMHSLTSKAKSYNRAPLSNCKSLMSALNSVPGNAKANLARIEKEKQEAAAREAQRKKEAAERAKQKEIEEINHDIEVSTDDTDF